MPFVSFTTGALRIRIVVVYMVVHQIFLSTVFVHGLISRHMVPEWVPVADTETVYSLF